MEILPPPTLLDRTWLLLITAITVALCVYLHAGGLRGLNRVLPHHPRKQYPLERVVLVLIVLHIIEVILFAGATMLLCDGLHLGRIEGGAVNGLADYVYFSMVCYTTVGFGDLVPVGALRLHCGIEAITGLVLVTWSASFTYLKMQQWRINEEPSD